MRLITASVDSASPEPRSGHSICASSRSTSDDTSHSSFPPSLSCPMFIVFFRSRHYLRSHAVSRHNSGNAQNRNQLTCHSQGQNNPLVAGGCGKVFACEDGRQSSPHVAD